MSTVLEQAERRLAALPEAEQAPRRELLGRIAGIVVERPLDQLTSLVDEFVQESAESGSTATWSLAEARTRNLERLLEDQARLVKETIRAATVRQGMNISRQRLHQLVAQGRLVAIQLQEGAPGLYPFWQFTSSAPVQPVTGLSRLLEAAREAGMDEVELHFFAIVSMLPVDNIQRSTPARSRSVPSPRPRLSVDADSARRRGGVTCASSVRASRCR